MKTEIKIAIADDHPIFRRGLREVVEMDARLKIVCEADDGDAALRCLENGDAEIAVLDIDMPGQDGFVIARRVREQNLPVRIVFLSLHKDERFFNRALDLGVSGYVLKDSAATEIVNCIKAVAAGHDYISPALSSFLIKRSRRTAALVAEFPGLNDLTPTERRILRLVGEYRTSKEIAEQLFISVRTVEHHRASISAKLNLKGSHALIKFAASLKG